MKKRPDDAIELKKVRGPSIQKIDTLEWYNPIDGEDEQEEVDFFAEILNS